jgi:hypothetical protein
VDDWDTNTQARSLLQYPGISESWSAIAQILRTRLGDANAENAFLHYCLRRGHDGVSFIEALEGRETRGSSQDFQAALAHHVQEVQAVLLGLLEDFSAMERRLDTSEEPFVLGQTANFQVAGLLQHETVVPAIRGELPGSGASPYSSFSTARFSQGPAAYTGLAESDGATVGLASGSGQLITGSSKAISSFCMLEQPLSTDGSSLWPPDTDSFQPFGFDLSQYAAPDQVTESELVSSTSHVAQERLADSSTAQHDPYGLAAFPEVPRGDGYWAFVSTEPEIHNQGSHCFSEGLAQVQLSGQLHLVPHGGYVSAEDVHDVQERFGILHEIDIVFRAGPRPTSGPESRRCACQSA